MANKGGRIRKSSGSDQDGFSDQNQTVAPSCTYADSASDSDTAVLAAVKEGCGVKAKLDREVTPPRPRVLPRGIQCWTNIRIYSYIQIFITE